MSNFEFDAPSKLTFEPMTEDFDILCNLVKRFNRGEIIEVNRLINLLVQLNKYIHYYHIGIGKLYDSMDEKMKQLNEDLEPKELENLNNRIANQQEHIEQSKTHYYYFIDCLNIYTKYAKAEYNIIINLKSFIEIYI
jgi:hypothetical protein